MILYTPLPLEKVLEDAEKRRGSTLQIPFSRGFLEVELISSTTAKIVRLISNNVQDYLNPSLQPGKEIKLKWSEEK